MQRGGLDMIEHEKGLEVGIEEERVGALVDDEGEKIGAQDDRQTHER